MEVVVVKVVKVVVEGEVKLVEVVEVLDMVEVVEVVEVEVGAVLCWPAGLRHQMSAAGLDSSARARASLLTTINHSQPGGLFPSFPSFLPSSLTSHLPDTFVARPPLLVC